MSYSSFDFNWSFIFCPPVLLLTFLRERNFAHLSTLISKLHSRMEVLFTRKTRFQGQVKVSLIIPRLALLANINFWGLSAVRTATWRPNEVLKSGCTAFLHTTSSLFVCSSRFLQISRMALWWQYVVCPKLSWISCRSSSSSRELINTLSAIEGMSSIFLSSASYKEKILKTFWLFRFSSLRCLGQLEIGPVCCWHTWWSQKISRYQLGMANSFGAIMKEALYESGLVQDLMA